MEDLNKLAEQINAELEVKMLDEWEFKRTHEIDLAFKILYPNEPNRWWVKKKVPEPSEEDIRLAKEWEEAYEQQQLERIWR